MPRLSFPIVIDERCRLHDAGGWIVAGVRGETPEVPERYDQILRALGDCRLVSAVAQPDDTLLAVHDGGLVDHVRHVWQRCQDAGLIADPTHDRIVGSLFHTSGFFDGLEPTQEPVAPWAHAGYRCFDTYTFIGPGTWEGAQAAVDCALSAADLVARTGSGAYALTRPPGHHVTRRAHGGNCYLNNAAVAAQRLREHGAERVAIVDIDAHHGNGTQTIFWERSDVWTGSVHIDPGEGYFPHVLGFASERGAGDGDGANLNVPLQPETGDDLWLAAVGKLLKEAVAHGAEMLVLALGVDAAAEDHESPLRVTEAGFREAGRAVGRLGLPTVVVQEGGYNLETLGILVRANLDGLDEGLAIAHREPEDHSAN